MAIYIPLVEGQDIITDDANKVTTGFFEGGVGTATAGTLTTSSLSTTQKNYYYNLQYSSKDHISVTYGHIYGSGSDSVTNLKGETEVIYKQFANYLLNPVNTGAGDSIQEGFQFVSGTIANDVYVLSFERAKMKDRINKKNWTLNVSGSDSASVATYLAFTDDSETTTATETTVGPRYNIVRGTLGTESGSFGTYGWFYPNVGLMVFNVSTAGSGVNSLSASLPGVVGTLASGSGYVGVGNGLAAELTTDGTADNAWKLTRALELTSQTFRNEEDQTTKSYFCRAKAPNFNFSNNPTFTSGSDNEYENTSFEGNPQTFITTVGLYDGSQTLVAVGRLSKPIKKNFSSEAVIKVNLTY
jgi:hypothetical protein